MLEGGDPQGKFRVAVEVAVQQPLLRRGQLYEGIQFQLGNGCFPIVVIGAGIHQQALLFIHRGHHQFHLVDCGDTVAHLEAQPAQWRTVPGVGAFLLHGGEGEGDATPLQLDDHSQAQLGVGVADPTLANHVLHQSRSPKNNSMLLR